MSLSSWNPSGQNLTASGLVQVRDAEARAAAEATARHAAAVADGDAEPDADAQRAANAAGLGTSRGAPRFFRNRHGHVQLCVLLLNILCVTPSHRQHATACGTSLGGPSEQSAHSGFVCVWCVCGCPHEVLVQQWLSVA
jgi:hypothetical protein